MKHEKDGEARNTQKQVCIPAGCALPASRAITKCQYWTILCHFLSVPSGGIGGRVMSFPVCSHVPFSGGGLGGGGIPRDGGYDTCPISFFYKGQHVTFKLC